MTTSSREMREPLQDLSGDHTSRTPRPAGAAGGHVALYSAGLFFFIGPFSALLFFIRESFPVRTRPTGSSLINASGQVGAILGGVLITASLTAGQSWEMATLWSGCLPILLAGLLIFAAPNMDRRTVRTN